MRWINARAESLPTLDLPAPRLVTFGQSFHWTDRQPVAAPVPHEAIREIVRRYLGSDSHEGHGRRPASTERFTTSLAASRFGVARTVHAPGRADLVRSVDDVIDNYLSMSFAAPRLFGPHLGAFIEHVRALLLITAPDGRFREWPGDTEIVLATKSGLR